MPFKVKAYWCLVAGVTRKNKSLWHYSSCSCKGVDISRWRVFLFSPGREVMMGRAPWHSCPVCQSAWQAEQNRRLQRGHCTSWDMGNTTSCSWHTAWQEEDGQQVQQGSSSNSAWQAVRDIGTFYGIMDFVFELCMKEFKSNKHKAFTKVYSYRNTEILQVGGDFIAHQPLCLVVSDIKSAGFFFFF